MRAYTAPVECLSREELLHKVQELRQGMAELSLQQLIAQREEMQQREAALRERETKLAAEHERLAQCEMQIATREVEVAMREAAVAAREGGNLCGSNSAPQLHPQQHCQLFGAKLESPGCSRIGFLPCTPSPPRLEVPPLPPDSAGSAHSGSGGAGFYGGGLGALPELQVEDGYTHFAHHMSPQQPPELRSPLPGGPPPTPPPPARRLSGAGQGSARRLKAMFEKRAGEVDSRLSGASAPGGTGPAPTLTAQTARNPRRTAPPFPVAAAPTLVGRGSGPGPGPAPKVSLQDLLTRDEARRSSQGGA